MDPDLTGTKNSKSGASLLINTYSYVIAGNFSLVMSLSKGLIFQIAPLPVSLYLDNGTLLFYHAMYVVLAWYCYRKSSVCPSVTDVQWAYR